MTPPARARLSNRRPSYLETIKANGQIITACVGFDPTTGQPCEVFLNGGKEGSQFDAMLAEPSQPREISVRRQRKAL